MSYDDKNDINTKLLAESWGVPMTTVGGLISGAISGKRLRTELIEEYNYAPEDIPAWFYSPKPEGTSEELVTNRVHSPKPAMSSPVASPEEVYDPEIPVPKEPGIKAPESLKTGLSGLEYTEEQVLRLRQQGVTFDKTNQIWVKITPQGRGQYVETVNSDTVLNKLQEQENQKTTSPSVT